MKQGVQRGVSDYSEAERVSEDLCVKTCAGQVHTRTSEVVSAWSKADKRNKGRFIFSPFVIS